MLPDRIQPRLSTLFAIRVSWHSPSFADTALRYFPSRRLLPWPAATGSPPRAARQALSQGGGLLALKTALLVPVGVPFVPRGLLAPGHHVHLWRVFHSHR